MRGDCRVYPPTTVGIRMREVRKVECGLKTIERVGAAARETIREETKDRQGVA